MLDMEPTTVKVIVPTSPYYEQVMKVEATYDDDVYARADDGRVIRYHRTQVETVHVRDWDQFLCVDGHITTTAQHAIRTFAETLPNCVNVGGGWTGKGGHVTIRFELGCAEENLPALAAFVHNFNLTASKPRATLFG